ncbi:MAG: DUF2079 domain-containing protein [Candidatus Limnocylindrales bacterium]
MGSPPRRSTRRTSSSSSWSVSQGYGFRSSFNPGDFLGLHFSPLLVVPAALQVVWPDARLLSLLQVIALGLAVPAAFLFVRAVLRPHRRQAGRRSS